jgi:hypothetical protein
MSTIDTSAKDIIEGLARMISNAPVIDRRAVELAFQRHFQTLGLATPPVRWSEGAYEFYLRSSQG